MGGTAGEGSFSLQIFFEAEGGEGEGTEAEEEKNQDFRPENGQTVSFEKDSADGLSEEPEGIEVGEVLDDFRHALYGSEYSGQQHGRHEKEEGAGHRLLLGAGKSGDEEPDAEGSQNEEEGDTQEKNDTAFYGKPEDDFSGQDDQHDIDQTDDNKGGCFADNQLPRSDGGNDERFQSSHFPFLGDSHRGQKER